MEYPIFAQGTLIEINRNDLLRGLLYNNDVLSDLLNTIAINRKSGNYQTSSDKEKAVCLINKLGYQYKKRLHKFFCLAKHSVTIEIENFFFEADTLLKCAIKVVHNGKLAKLKGDDLLALKRALKASNAELAVSACRDLGFEIEIKTA